VASLAVLGLDFVLTAMMLCFPQRQFAENSDQRLLGDQYLGIEAGADEQNLAAGDVIGKHPVGRGAGKPDQSIPLQQGGRNIGCQPKCQTRGSHEKSQACVLHRCTGFVRSRLCGLLALLVTACASGPAD
jgi:hypothetical protein